MQDEIGNKLGRIIENQPKIPEEVRARLFPGYLMFESSGGFIGSNEDPDEVIKNDLELLAAVNITPEEIAAALEDAQKSYGVHRTVYNGVQDCPFADGPASDTSYLKLDGKKGIGWSGLHPHLIRAHHFFEGKGVSHRLEPIEAILMLGIKSPTHSVSELENIHKQIMDEDIKSPYEQTRNRALSTLGLWYPSDPDVIKRLMELAKSEELEDVIAPLIDICLTDNPSLEPVKSVLAGRINEFKPGSVEWKFLRDFNPPSDGNKIIGYYWSDYINFPETQRRCENGKLSICLDFISKFSINPQKIAELGAPFYIEQYPAKNPTEVIEFIARRLTESDRPYRPYKDDLPYLKHPKNNEEEQKRINYWTFIAYMDAQTLYPASLKSSLFELIKSLDSVGRKVEALEYVPYLIRLYEADEYKEKYQDNLDYLRSL